MLSKTQAIVTGVTLGFLLFLIYVRFQQTPTLGAPLTAKVEQPHAVKPPSLIYETVKQVEERQRSVTKQQPSINKAPPTSSNSQIELETRILAEPFGASASTASKLRRDPSVACPKLKKRYHVVPGSSWGSLTVELQKLWTSLDCDQFMKGVHEPEEQTGSPVDTASPVDAAATEEVSEDPGGEVGMPSLSKEKRRWCKINRDKYKVKPMKSWGQLPASMIDEWKSKQCDLVFTANRMGKRPVSSCPNGPLLQNTSALVHSNMAPSLPLIAVMAATTTRKIVSPSTSKLALFTLLLPSLMRSLDCGFRYVYVLGYDEGDAFYDSDAGMKEVQTWFEQNVRLPLSKNGISLTLRLVKVRNTIKKPGPVFLEMARAAYADGAQYFYRINDDTELMAPWATLFTETLQSLGFPYGVVGPNCEQGNNKILTHDFVHRTHMDIFGMNYYPPALTDWWMDDWISWVYGQTRTFKARAVGVIHHTGAHGQRYQVDSSHEALLGDLVKQGRQQIRQYMLKHQGASGKNSVSAEALQRFDKDTAAPGFMHRDVPAAVKDRVLQQPGDAAAAEAAPTKKKSLIPW